MTKTTIVVERKTREELRKRGSKGQTYDQVINELLLESKDFDGSLDPSLKTVSSESIKGDH